MKNSHSVPDPLQIRNVWAVGRNYVDHAKELNNPVPLSPLIFLKAGSCITTAPAFTLPKNLQDIHFECEIAVQINRKAEPQKIGLALDLTARTLQGSAKKKGEPWTQSKSFIDACPLGPLVNFPNLEDFNHLSFEFFVNDHLTQEGSVQSMIFTLPVLLNHLKEHYPLCEGDIILTGTPAGVGPLKAGDRLKAQFKSSAVLPPYQLTWDVN
jgi:acylpyruvate hydrolase